MEKDKRALQIEEQELERVRKDLDDQLRIMENDTFQRVEKMLIGKVADGGPAGSRPAPRSPRPTSVSWPRRLQTEWLEIRLRAEESASQLEAVANQIKQQREDFRERFEVKKRKITQGDDLAPACSRWSRPMWR